MISDELEFRRRMGMTLLGQLERAAGGDPELLAEFSSKLLVKANQGAAVGACEPEVWLEAMTTLGSAIVESLALWRRESVEESLQRVADWIEEKTSVEEQEDDEREERIRHEADLKAFELSVGRDLMQLPVVPE